MCEDLLCYEGFEGQVEKKNHRLNKESEVLRVQQHPQLFLKYNAMALKYYHYKVLYIGDIIHIQLTKHNYHVCTIQSVHVQMCTGFNPHWFLLLEAESGGKISPIYSSDSSYFYY